MIMNNFVSRRVFFLQESLLGRKTDAFAKEFARSQWFPPEKLRAIQVAKLRKLLKHAYTTVPYYKSIIDEYGCRYDTIKSLDDLQRIPVLSKDAIRDQTNLLLSTSADKFRMRDTCTTGSTGQYLTLKVSAERAAVNNALEIRNRQWLGADYFGRKLLLWGRPQSGDSVQLSVKGLRDALLNKKKFICDAIGHDDARLFVQLITSWKPEYLYCYAGSVAHMARLCLEQNISIDFPELKGIVTTAEVLFAYQRKMIEKAFNVQVFNEYGSAECGLIAHECEFGAMHINAESVIVEVDDGGDSSANEGELIITNLHSFGMPIIRYKPGDMGSLSGKTCACGRGLPLLGTILGRTVDAMYARDGKRIDSLVVDTIAEDDSIKCFKIHQINYTNIDVSFSVTDSYNCRFEKVFICELERLFGYKLNIRFSYKDLNDMQSGKKFRHITSDVSMH